MAQTTHDDDNQKRILNLAHQLTPDQCAYLRSIAKYEYKYFDELAQQLLQLDLIVRYGQLLVANEIGRAVSMVCVPTA